MSPVKVHRADGIGVVVDVGRMQPGLAAVLPRPFRLGADQAHTGAAGVVMHFPFGGKEGLDVGWRKEIRCAMRTVQHADLPLLAIRRDQICRQCAMCPGRRFHAEVQHIAGAQRAPAVTAELAQREGGFAAKIIRHIETACHGQIGPATAALHRAKPQHAACLDHMAAPEFQRLAIQLGFHRCTSQRDDSVVIEFQRWAGNGQFQSCCIVCVAQQLVNILRSMFETPRRVSTLKPDPLPFSPCFRAQSCERILSLFPREWQFPTERKDGVNRKDGVRKNGVRSCILTLFCQHHDLPDYST